MIDIKEEQLIEEWTGFTVYSAETGAKVENLTVSVEHCGDDFSISGKPKWTLNEDGELCVVICGKSFVLNRYGHFIIQFGNGMYMRW